VVIDKDNTTIIEGGVRPSDRGPGQQIRTQIEETTSDYDREKLQSGWRSWSAASR